MTDQVVNAYGEVIRVEPDPEDVNDIIVDITAAFRGMSDQIPFIGEAFQSMADVLAQMSNEQFLDLAAAAVAESAPSGRLELWRPEPPAAPSRLGGLIWDEQVNP